jgi:hypothetical protein
MFMFATDNPASIGTVQYTKARELLAATVYYKFDIQGLQCDQSGNYEFENVIDGTRD